LAQEFFLDLFIGKSMDTAVVDYTPLKIVPGVFERMQKILVSFSGFDK
jgi:hypothetical protein